MTDSNTPQNLESTRISRFVSKNINTHYSGQSKLARAAYLALDEKERKTMEKLAGEVFGCEGFAAPFFSMKSSTAAGAFFVAAGVAVQTALAFPEFFGGQTETFSYRDSLGAAIVFYGTAGFFFAGSTISQIVHSRANKKLGGMNEALRGKMGEIEQQGWDIDKFLAFAEDRGRAPKDQAEYKAWEMAQEQIAKIDTKSAGLLEQRKKLQDKLDKAVPGLAP